MRGRAPSVEQSSIDACLEMQCLSALTRGGYFDFMLVCANGTLYFETCDAQACDPSAMLYSPTTPTACMSSIPLMPLCSCSDHHVALDAFNSRQVPSCSRGEALPRSRTSMVTGLINDRAFFWAGVRSGVLGWYPCGCCKCCCWWCCSCCCWLCRCAGSPGDVWNILRQAPQATLTDCKSSCLFKSTRSLEVTMQ